MSISATPKGPRTPRTWIALSMLAVAAAVLFVALATGRGGGVPAERSTEPASAPTPPEAAPPPPPVIPAGSDLAPGATSPRVGGAKRAPAPEVPVARVRVHGRVTASEPGPAIVGTVAVQGSIDKKPAVLAKATIDADGRYEATFAFERPAKSAVSSDVLLVVVAPGWGPEWVSLDVPGGGEFERDIRLVPNRIFGRVVDPRGRGLAGLDLRADARWSDDAMVDSSMLDATAGPSDDRPLVRTVTDSEGRFELRGLGWSGYRLFLASSDWFLKTTKLQGGEPEIVLTAVPAVSIDGVVRDAHSSDVVESTVYLSRVRSTHAGATTQSTYHEFPVVTRGGRFRFVMAAPDADDDVRFTARAIPLSLDYAEAPRVGPFSRDERRHDVELLVERLGSGFLVLDVTTPRGAAFSGPIRVRLEPGERGGGQREPKAVLERAGRYRIQVPAERDWDAVIEVVAPESDPALLPSEAVHVSVRVADRGEFGARAVLPGFGHLVVRWSGDGVFVHIESLGQAETSHATLQVAPGSTPPAEGIQFTVPEGRYRLSLVGGPAERSRDVEVGVGADTVVDFR